VRLFFFGQQSSEGQQNGNASTLCCVGYKTLPGKSLTATRSSFAIPMKVIAAEKGDLQNGL
jgi:hypothetical protein